MSWHTGQLPGSLWQKWLLKARNLKHQAKKLWRHWCWISPGWYTKAILCSRAVKIILIAAWNVIQHGLCRERKATESGQRRQQFRCDCFFFFLYSQQRCKSPSPRPGGHWSSLWRQIWSRKPEICPAAAADPCIHTPHLQEAVRQCRVKTEWVHVQLGAKQI